MKFRIVAFALLTTVSLCAFGEKVKTQAPAVAPAGANHHTVFGSVSLDHRQLNAALDGTASVAVTLRRAGTLDVMVVDRDGFPVRQLARGSAAPAATSRFSWDGRDDAGRIVPDEAYSFRIVWSGGGQREVYFPANQAAHMQSVPIDGFSPQNATLSYSLAVPSRVHVQAGVAVKNPKTGVMEGPVLKTVVNRAPRAAGRIAEHWNGLDESGALFLPDLKNFVLAIATTPLPESSVITIGNRERTFTEAALTRSGKSLFTYSVASHAHHMGLMVLDDVSPGLRIEPVNARWSEVERVWVTSDSTLKLKLTLTGPAATNFARQPGRMFRFLNQKLIGESKASQGELAVALPARGDGVHNLSLNWRSDYGAVAANTIRVRRAGSNERTAGARGAAR